MWRRSSGRLIDGLPYLPSFHGLPGRAGASHCRLYRGAKYHFREGRLMFQCLFFRAADKDSPEDGGTLDLVKDGETDVADPVGPHEIGDCLM